MIPRWPWVSNIFFTEKALPRMDGQRRWLGTATESTDARA
jgi:hypothetical protein